MIGLVLETRYRIDGVIGRAHGNGVVYRGMDVGTGTAVVIRCPAIPPDLEDPRAALNAFLAEANLLSRVGQATPDVEKLLAFGVVEVRPGQRLAYCVFEWLAGRSLEEDRAGRPPLSLGEAIVILEPAARALATAHALGAAHRDVRPKNLWISTAAGHARLKVAAFTLATRVGPGEDPFAAEYAAPEHFKRSFGALGPATDVYGLALVLVEMVSGRRALEGRDPGDFFLATGDLAKRPTLRARGAHVSDAVEAVVARALAVDPRRRFGNARDFWDALLASMPERTPAAPSVVPVAPQPLASRPPGVVTRPPPPVVAASAPPPPRTAPAIPSDPPEEPGRTPWAWYAVAVIAVIAIAIVVAKVGRSAAPRPPPRPAPSGSSGLRDEPAVKMKAFLPDMVRVPAGTFVMGSDKEGKGERPAHSVEVTRAFYIDRTEVTAEKYAACVDDGACTAGSVHGAEAAPSTYGCNGKDKPRHPANCVDRAQAEAYCKWAQKRLPTEAEWEYAARGADAREYPWGNAAPTTCAAAIVTGVSGPCSERKGTSEVGTTADGKSPFGALDMAGNVWEWVADGYEEYAGAKTVDPRVPLAPGGKGVLRGGSWDYSIPSAKTTYRLPFPAAGGNVSIGFRCAMDAAD